MKDRWVNGCGNLNAELLLVGEAPAEKEVERGKPFVGRTGQEVDSYLYKVLHIPREDVYATNMFRYQLNDDKKYSDSEFEMMGELLADEIATVNPTVILSMGAISTKYFIPGYPDMEAVNALPHYWISPVDSRRYIVVPSIHPAAAFRDSSIMQWVIEAFTEAGRCLSGKERLIVAAAGQLQFDIVTMEELLATEPKRNTLIAIDTEAYHNGSPYMVQASNSKRRSAYLYADTVPGGIDLSRLAKYVAHPNVTTLMHNALYDLPILQSLGVNPQKYVCTMQMAFLLQTLPLGLKSLAYRLLQIKMKDYDEVVGDNPDLSYVNEADRLQYACGDPVATLLIYKAMRPLRYSKFDKVLKRDVGIMPIVDAMMQHGIPADREYFQTMQGELAVRNLELAEEMRELLGNPLIGPKKEPFNPGSHKHVAEIVYKRLHLGDGYRIKKTKWGGSTDKHHMKKIQGTHPIASMIQDYRETDTLINTFLNKLPQHIAKDGRIHTKISMVRIKHSGRLASSSPNLMNQPVRTEDGRRIRRGFVAPPGYVFMSFDYSQIEMRLVAHRSRDPVMCDAYLKNKDIHTETAMRIFGIRNIDDVDDMLHRHPAKRIGFGVIYGITAQGLARELVEIDNGAWTEDRCQEMLDSWFGVYKGIRDYIMRVQAHARRFGQVTDMWGRMEYIPQIVSAFPYIKEEGLRIAVNQDIQSGAQGIIKEAMVRVWPQASEWVRKDVAYPIMQIHDDLMFMVREDCQEEVVSVVRPIMEGSVKLCIPVIVEPKYGMNWGEMKKWKQ